MMHNRRFKDCGSAELGFHHIDVAPNERLGHMKLMCIQLPQSTQSKRVMTLCACAVHGSK